MNKRIIVLGVAVLLGVCVALPNAYSAEGEEDLNYAYGEVVRLGDNQIVVREINLDDEEVENTYVVNEQTQFENVDAFSGIMVNDALEVFYRMEAGNSIAVAVIKELPDEGYGEWENSEEVEMPISDESAE